MRAMLFLCVIALASFRHSVNNNRQEYYKAISTLIRKIQTQKNYQLDTVDGVWLAKSKNGFQCFQGETEIKNENDDYTITFSSLIYSEDYFKRQPSFKVLFSILREDNTTNSSFLIVNTASESFEDLPFKMKDAIGVYYEKKIDIPFSETLVFNRTSFSETYIVLYKEKKIIRYILDSSDRKFYQDSIGSW